MTGRSIYENSAAAGRVPSKKPWWLMGRSVRDGWLQLLVTVLLLTAFLLRDSSLVALDYLFVAVGAGLVLCAIATIIAFSRHPEWKGQFERGPLSTRELHQYAWVVGILAIAGIVCVVLAFVLSIWALCGVALLLFLFAFIAGSNIGNRPLAQP